MTAFQWMVFHAGLCRRKLMVTWKTTVPPAKGLAIDLRGDDLPTVWKTTVGLPAAECDGLIL